MKVDFHSWYPYLLTNEHLRKYVGDEGDTVLHVYSDTYVKESRIEPGSVAMLIEPRDIMPEIYDYMEKNYSRFRYVFTFDDRLREIADNAKLILYGTAWGWFNEPKTKEISMTCSEKQYCEGHKNRVKLARMLENVIDTYGRYNGGAYADTKDIYAPYMFNVAVENCRDGYYFTEKICTCFTSRTVPIYWGCEHIGEFFDMDGVIQVQDVFEIPDVLNELFIKGVRTEYDRRREAIENNYRIVKDYADFGTTFCRMHGELLREIANGN